MTQVHKKLIQFVSLLLHTTMNNKRWICTFVIIVIKSIHLSLFSTPTIIIVHHWTQWFQQYSSSFVKWDVHCFRILQKKSIRWYRSPFFIYYLKFHISFKSVYSDMMAIPSYNFVCTHNFNYYLESDFSQCNMLLQDWLERKWNIIGVTCEYSCQ